MRASVLIIVLAVATASAASASIETRTRDIYRELVEINTSDTPAGNVTAAADAMAARLRAAGFPASDVQVLVPPDNPRKGNLVARYRGTGSRRPLLLLAHLDVVDARPSDWSVDPFTLIERDGYFYGRGTSDDKAMAAHFVSNFIRLREEGYRPERDLILALTADEEGGRFNGVTWLLNNHRSLIEAEFAINEGGGGTMRDGRYLTMEVQASEKVYQDFRIETTHPGGHSSMPLDENPIYRLSEALGRLARYAFPLELTDVTRAYFERTATVERDRATAADMRAAARSSDRAAAARLAQRLPAYNALMRTTCVATRLDGGHANNALPQTASAVVNCRILPGTAPAVVRRRLIAVIGDPKIDVTSIEEATASTASPLRDDLLTAVASLTHELHPDVAVVPVMSTGATDGLYLRNAGIPTYGIDGTFYDIDDVRAHGKDERVGVKQFFEGLEFQYRLIKLLSGTALRTPSSPTTR